MILRGERLRSDVERREFLDLSKASWLLWGAKKEKHAVPESIRAAIAGLDGRVERMPEEFYALCTAVKQMMKEAKKKEDMQAEEERQLVDALRRSTVEQRVEE